MRSFRTKLFFAYSLTLISIALMISIPMYFYLKNNIEKNIVTNVDQVAYSTASNISLFLSMFDNMTIQLYNNYDNTRSTVANYLEQLSKVDGNDSNESLLATNAVNNFLNVNSVIYKNIEQINLITLGGNQYSKSYGDSNVNFSVSTRFDFQETDQANGGTVLGIDPRASSSLPKLIMTRKLMWNSHDIGYLEATIAPDSIVESSKLQALNGVSLLILKKNRIIFASDEPVDQSLASLLARLGETGRKERTGIFIPDRAEGYFLVDQAVTKSDYSVLIAAPADKLFHPLTVFRNAMLAIVFIIIVFSVAFYYFLARILTQPIVAMKKAIDSMKIDEEPGISIDNKFNMNEIESLRRSFQRMDARLKASMDEKLRFRTLQMQSHFHVLQAQINPHFLFNTLGVITVMADSGDAPSISDISRKLSHFLRYSISTDSLMSTVENELIFTESYLELMKFRYLHRLRYVIDLPDSMRNLAVPKLFLQPIIENSIQHGLDDEKDHLLIRIKCSMQADHWEMTISDNGAGFPETRLKWIHDKIEDFIYRLQDNSEYPNTLTLGGMGLVNTMARLKMMWKDQFSYSLGNRPGGGAMIILKGPIGGVPGENSAG